MHVLLTNDDGPPNDIASAYIRFLVDAIEKYTDWDLSIVVPDVQRSWIGKAHFAGKELTASFIYPNKDTNSFNGPFPVPGNDKYVKQGLKEWALIDGTPASCADIGIHHLYQEKGPVDLVLSGPNVGKNTSASYILSSGTVGAALEAAIHGKRAIGISYGYTTRDADSKVLSKAAEMSVKLIKYLCENWDTKGSIDVYSVNIPLVESLLEQDRTKVFYTPILHNRWVSIFEVDKTTKSASAEDNTDIVDVTTSSRLQFKWAPNFDYVHKTIRDSTTLNDGKVLDQGNISITPLRASFADAGISEEIKDIEL